MAARRLSKKMYKNRKNTKNPKFTKNDCNLYILQNKSVFFDVFLKKKSNKFYKGSKIFWHFGFILYNTSLF